MNQLLALIPDVDVLLALEPEELGAKMLFLLRKHPDGGGQFHPGSLADELQNPHYPNVQPYPQHRSAEVSLALAEAWGWLQAQGLIVAADGINANHGWKRLSRRARKFENEAEFTQYALRACCQRERCTPRSRRLFGWRSCGANSMSPCSRQ